MHEVVKRGEMLESSRCTSKRTTRSDSNVISGSGLSSGAFDKRWTHVLGQCRTYWIQEMVRDQTDEISNFFCRAGRKVWERFLNFSSKRTI